MTTKLILWLASLFAVAAGAGTWAWTNRAEREAMPTAPAAQGVPQAPVVATASEAFTCPMCGGQFTSPGACPKCGMALVRADQGAGPRPTRPAGGGC